MTAPDHTVLEGEAEFRVDGDRRLVLAGEAIVLPPHSRHGFTNVGGGVLRTLAGGMSLASFMTEGSAAAVA